MKKSYVKFLATGLAIFMIISVLGGCTKSKQGDTSQSTTSSGQKSAGKTTPKSSSANSSTNVKNDSTGSTSASSQGAGNSQNGENTIIGYTEDGSPIIAQGDSGAQGGVTEETMDLGGKTIILASSNKTHQPRDTADASLDIAGMYKNLQTIEGKYNFELEFKCVPTNFYQEVTSTTLAGIKFADIIRTSSTTTYLTLIKQGIIIPLDDYINYEEPVMKNNPYMYAATAWKGKHYGVTRTFQTSLVNSGMMYNADLLARDGQPDILGLVDNGQWKWEQFLDIALNCTKDINGDGIVDQWGMVTDSNYTLSQKILYSNGVGFMDVNNDGDLYLTLNSTQGQRALQFVSDLTFVHKVVSSAGLKDYQNGMTAMCIYDAWKNMDYLNQGSLWSTIAPLPMGPDMSTETIVCGGVNWDSVLSTCEMPKEVARICKEYNILWDENLNPSPVYQSILDSRPKWWEQTNRWMATERQSNIFWRTLPLKVDFSPAVFAVAPECKTAISSAITSIFNGTMSVSQAVESVKSQTQAAIDKAEN